MELTVGDVRRSKTVIHEDTIGFSHFQVDHVWGIFQGSHGMLMGNLLQAGAIHLRPPKHTQTQFVTLVYLTSTRSTIGNILFPYSKKFVSYLQPPVFVCGSTFNNLSDVDAIVPWDVLIPNTPCYTETKTWDKQRYKKKKKKG